MSRVYDIWEKLVGAVLDREKLREIAYWPSFSSATSSIDSSIEDVHGASSRLSNFSYRDVQPIEFEEIIKATKYFKPDKFIGEGIFCQVFKAWIDENTLTATKPGSGMAVAVRKWNPVGLEKHQDWVKEINHLTELRHLNLVDLVGYCSKEDNMILVFEFMGKGSLDDHLFIRHQSLPWITRIKVAIDVARGLSFLHAKEIPIIHRDFKTANILLDGEFTNYWYGRDDPIGDMTHVSTDQVVVTYGYVAPEYEETGYLSTKSNLYTFGVVMLELLIGVRGYGTIWPRKEQYLAEWAKPYLGDKKRLLQIMDTRLKGQYTDDEAYKFAKLAY